MRHCFVSFPAKNTIPLVRYGKLGNKFQRYYFHEPSLQSIQIRIRKTPESLLFLCDFLREYGATGATQSSIFWPSTATGLHSKAYSGQAS
ncbi:hypothetical protein RHMOL_Rhmol10G0233000 [Rhododendron molle]|uniref:Uncharacterized protein n=1 Tax=Rhododendron molle TaxID=49168 RepID=A0ACC0M5B3_RHOML|nr:hypothetical protein RHMOL_Rhmol10G0233000 [Rhododendron molle]